MVEPNENFLIFLTLFVLYFSLPKFLLLFRVKLLFMLFMLLIAFQVLLSTIKLHMSAFLGHLQIITIFAPSVLLVSFFFNHEHNKLEPRSRLCCFLGYGETQMGYWYYDPISHHLRVSPQCCLFGTSLLCRALSLQCLPIFLLCLRSFSR